MCAVFHAIHKTRMYLKETVIEAIRLHSAGIPQSCTAMTRHPLCNSHGFVLNFTYKYPGSSSTSTLQVLFQPLLSFSIHPFANSTLLTQETLRPSCTADFALRCTIEFLSSLTLFLSTGGELSVETGTQTCSQVPPLPP